MHELLESWLESVRFACEVQEVVSMRLTRLVEGGPQAAAETQQIALQAAMLIAFLPTFMLSGFIFPISSMPVFLQYVTTIVPARYFLVALRGVVLKGLGLPSLWQPVAALGVYAVVTLGLSAARLARR